jgi:hypothetical protein
MAAGRARYARVPLGSVTSAQLAKPVGAQVDRQRWNSREELRLAIIT